ncbi:mandelate racemase/muconate lactonizing enzyme family protein [Streptomyces sp. NPDC094447]|uniref:mandelate racemase/muconate lactonizing enzyme family protein n=1 Tax=Streptomyces sp. NPDC094447 TaxID=3366062 RepID=UPI003809638C
MSSHPVPIVKIEALALSAGFDDLYDSPEDVPDWLRRPSSRDRVQPRHGRYATLVRVHAEDGTIGTGECHGNPSPEVTATVVTAVLAPLLIGQDALATTAVWERLYGGQAVGGHTRGFSLEALAGVDLALWDLRGKLAGVPVHRLLGGPIRDRIDCYASPVAFHDDPEDSAQQALDFVVDGFKALKVKIGRGERTDRAHLTAVREAVGEDIGILTDADCAYDLDQATRVGRVLRDLAISWYEEPLQADDLAGLTELRRRTGLTLVNGGTHLTRFDLRDSLLNCAVDVFAPDVARCGGITEATRLAALTSAFHVGIAPHDVGSGVSLCAALQLCAATSNFRQYGHDRLPNPIHDRILMNPPEFKGGTLAVPQGPGLGAEIDWDAVDRYTVAHF